jgi:thioredoxin 1
LADSKAVFVDYSAIWCGTCKRQERVINALRAADPAYDNSMTFMKVDCGAYKNFEVAVFREIPCRATLIILCGEQELGRVFAETSENQIKVLMDVGL